MKYKIINIDNLFEVVDCEDDSIVGVFETNELAIEFMYRLESQDSGFEGNVPSFFTRSVNI